LYFNKIIEKYTRNYEHLPAFLFSKTV